MNRLLNKFGYIALFSGLGIFSYLFLVNHTNLSQTVIDVLSTIQALIFVIAAFNILGFTTIKLSAWINGQYSSYIKRKWKIVVVYSIVILILFLLNYGLIITAKLLVGATHPFTFPNGGIGVLILVWLVEMVILGLLMTNASIQKALKLQKETALLQEENNKARYSALQNQLNPHFLFNSLNTLIAEIEYNPTNAVIFTKNLSDVYRYVLQCQHRPLITLSEELEFAQAYLFLHEVRLGHCIEWNNTIPGNYLESLLPPLTLQLLVENVIKHNVMNINKPMLIRVYVEDNKLIVSNTVNLKKNNEQSGVGLQNLSNRCLLILGKPITITSDEELFTVKIPLSYE